MTRPNLMPVRSGFHNLENGHDPLPHVQRTLRRMKEHRLRVLGISEGRGYLSEFIRQAPDYGMKVVHDRGRALGSDQNYIICAADARVTRQWSFQAGTGWFRKGGGTMAPMRPMAAIIDGCTFVAAHAPVAAWRPVGGSRRFIGPLRRRIAYRGFVLRLALLFRRHKHVIVWADWNATPKTRGRYSPEWLRRKVGGVYLRPYKNTGHGEIDFAIGKNVEAVMAHVEKGYPSDHQFVWAYTVFRRVGAR